jgi:hypothetical protein
MLFESLGFKLWTVWSLVRKNAVLYCTVHPDEQVVYNSAILFFLQYCQKPGICLLREMLTQADKKNVMSAWERLDKDIHALLPCS